MKKGLDKWFKAVTIHDTEYYNVCDCEDGSKIITFLANHEGRVFRLIFSKEDVARFNGAVAVETTIETKKAVKVHSSFPHQDQKPVVLPPIYPEQEEKVPPEEEFQGLFPGQ